MIGSKLGRKFTCVFVINELLSQMNSQASAFFRTRVSVWSLLHYLIIFFKYIVLFICQILWIWTGDLPRFFPNQPLLSSRPLKIVSGWYYFQPTVTFHVSTCHFPNRSIPEQQLPDALPMTEERKLLNINTIKLSGNLIGLLRIGTAWPSCFEAIMRVIIPSCVGEHGASSVAVVCIHVCASVGICVFFSPVRQNCTVIFFLPERLSIN